jgi:hypothetical protein
MDQSLTVRVIDGLTGEIFVSAEVRLYPIGTPGEHCAVTGQDGCYWFDDLPDSELITPGKLKSTDGVFGIRLAHNTDATVTGLTMTSPEGNTP